MPLPRSAPDTSAKFRSIGSPAIGRCHAYQALCSLRSVSCPGRLRPAGPTPPAHGARAPATDHVMQERAIDRPLQDRRWIVPIATVFVLAWASGFVVPSCLAAEILEHGQMSWQPALIAIYAWSVVVLAVGATMACCF